MLKIYHPFEFSCPVSWAHVKFGQFLQICTGPVTPERKLAILCNLTDEQVGQLSDFQKEQLYEKLLFTTDFSLLEAQPAPKIDVGEETYQQLLTAMMVLTGVENIWTKAAFIYALYTYPKKLWKEFDLEKIRLKAADAETRPVLEVYPAAAFFFGRLTSSLMNLPPMRNHPDKNLPSMLKNSQTWAYCLSWIRSRVETCSNTPTSLPSLLEKISEN